MLKRHVFDAQALWLRHRREEPLVGFPEGAKDVLRVIRALLNCYGRSVNLGISWGSTYQDALEPQNMMFCGRMAGSLSRSPAGIRYSSRSAILCGTLLPQRLQNDTAKVLAPGSLK